MFRAFLQLTGRIITVTSVRHLSVKTVRIRFVIAGISRRISAMIRRRARRCLDTVTRVFEKVIRLRNIPKSICPSASWWIAYSRRKDKKDDRPRARILIRILIQNQETTARLLLTLIGSFYSYTHAGFMSPRKYRDIKLGIGQSALR